MTEQEYSGVAIMARLSSSYAKMLAVPGGERADELHVTLGFLDQQNDEISVVSRVVLRQNLEALKAQFPLQASIFARAEFNYSNNYSDERPPCSVYLIQSQQLCDVKKFVDQAIFVTHGISADQGFPIWTPHVTIGYGLDINKLAVPANAVLYFDTLVISWGGNIQKVWQ